MNDEIDGACLEEGFEFFGPEGFSRDGVECLFQVLVALGFEGCSGGTELRVVVEESGDDDVGLGEGEERVAGTDGDGLRGGGG